MPNLLPTTLAKDTPLSPLYQGALRHKRQVDAAAGGHDMFHMESQTIAPKYFCLACSDSRIDPYKIFDMPAGQIFEPRNMGGVATLYQGTRRASASAWGDDSFADSLLCALAMQVDYILVLGHTRCGTTKRVMDKAAYLDGTQDDVASNRWLNGLDAVRSRVGALYSNVSVEERYQAAVGENTRLQRERILAHTGVQNALTTGALLGVEAFVYEIEPEQAGIVSHWQESQRRFVPINGTVSLLPAPVRSA